MSVYSGLDDLGDYTGMSERGIGEEYIDTASQDGHGYHGGGALNALSPQTWAFSYIVLSLALLWILGGVFFSRANH